jgi:hypothetical protein
MEEEYKAQQGIENDLDEMKYGGGLVEDLELNYDGTPVGDLTKIQQKRYDLYSRIQDSPMFANSKEARTQLSALGYSTRWRSMAKY